MISSDSSSTTDCQRASGRRFRIYYDVHSAQTPMAGAPSPLVSSFGVAKCNQNTANEGRLFIELLRVIKSTNRVTMML